jgi:hypothetical protein
MTSQTYLIFIRDVSLALEVGTALEDRLSRDGHCGLALVPATRSLELAGAGCRRQFGAWQAGPEHDNQAPQVVALYEDGLLKRLESLGLAAYVGVPQEQEWRIVRWNNGAGAILLPVATARDLVEAVAAHTPWSQYAAEGPNVVSLRRRDGRRAGSGGPSALPRRIAIAGVAGPLVLVGLPAAAAASSDAAQSPGHTPPGAAVAALETNGQTQLDNAKASAAMAKQIRSTLAGSWPTPARHREMGFAYGDTAPVPTSGPTSGARSA